MADHTNRRLRILQMLPREGEGALTVTEIIEWLEREYGITETIRNVQRDLRELQDTENAGFPIACDEDSKPYRWAWYGKEEIGIPSLGRHTALALLLAEQLLKPLLPTDSFEHLRPNFTSAEKLLKKKSESKTRRWMDKVRVVPRGMRLLSAPIQSGVFDTVSRALYDDKQLELSYLAASNRTGMPNQYAVHPYALLHRGSITELVGQIDGDKKVRRWLLHRVQAATVLDVASVIPAKFDLDTYVQSELAMPFSGEEIPFKAWVRTDAVNHVTETMLDEEQSVEQVEDGVIVTARLRETVELKWWILGLGERIEVLEPQRLRDHIKQTVQAMAKVYKK